ncbi:MAG: M23 family metallopeptidase [Oscillospiraceae bacterium]|nr:M23 family metallopeptidase [Oscillospiraceae bacterium]
MNNEQLFIALNNADDKFILEAGDIETAKKRAPIWRTALQCAACAALVIAGIAVYRGSGVFTHDASDAPSSEALFCEPLELPEIDPAESWTGELPVMPLKEFYTPFEFSTELDRSSGWASTFLETARGKAVYAVADGEVVFSGIRDICDGMTVIVKVREDMYTSYSLLDPDSGMKVSEGDSVTAGQVIGYSGSTLTGWEGMCYTAYAYNPFDYQNSIDSAVLDEWTDLCVPIDGAENFNFFNTVAIVSRNERVTPAPRGTEVRAVDDGVVEDVYYGEGDRCGLIVTIRHSNGIESTYYHLDGSARYVERGDTVSKGDVIGLVSGESFSGVSGLGYCIDEHAHP